MKPDIMIPSQIEKESMRIIEEEMGETPHLSDVERIVLKRVIHTTADFDYVKNLKFSEQAVEKGIEAMRRGAAIVTDTNMAKAGISRPATEQLGCEVYCFMADDDVAREAGRSKTTRAALSMSKAAAVIKDRPLIFAIGNAPTALFRIGELIQEQHLSPALVIAAPVGFVNIIQSKQLIMQAGIPYIAADGRKGGSSVAAAVCNAMLYQLYDRNKQ